MVDENITVAVVGASGYTGGELTRLLLDHPRVQLAFLSAERQAGKAVGAVHPWLRNHPAAAALKLRSLDELEDVDVTFACLPTGALPSRMPLLAQRSRWVLNIAGDFRLRDPQDVKTHYPASASNPALEPFDYYVPELSDGLPESRFINLPGCMAVATLYALYPLFAESLVDRQIVADAKTGSSGAGREASEQPSERAGNFRVHRLHGHRHEPEICQALAEFTSTAPELQFSTHSLDSPRGIMVTAYARLRPAVAALDVKRAFA
ncbi:MAG: N-acetyl-gamma-glutamyl-phosphate reductase, partial [Acidobacteria bacterium]|nr:N-acetyl-gamma-glutamyl-phosphate reductase [Acidobacteriota bacterium]